MTYFQHTKADLAKQRAAGLIEGRREIAEFFAALLEDTARKMNGEPGGEQEYDRQYLVEDLLTRGAELAKNYVEDMPRLFPALVDNMRGTPAIPLLIESVRPHTFEAAHSPGACTAMVERNGFGEDCGLPPEHSIHKVAATQENTIDLSDAIRDAWRCETFNGRPRHEHIGHPDMPCRENVPTQYGTHGPRVQCGEYWGHAIHETDFDKRSDRP